MDLKRFHSSDGGKFIAFPSRCFNIIDAFPSGPKAFEEEGGGFLYEHVGSKFIVYASYY